MDNRSEIRDFLASRRARITPEQAGLLPGGGRRRVPGLRREEVAVLAGVSTDWYVRLEKGHIAGVSDDVLEAVARALRLDDAERAPLFDLARAARPSRAPRRRNRVTVRPRVQWLLDTMTGSAAIALNGRMDVLAANGLGRALYSQVFDDARRPANIARFQFLDPAARDFCPAWDQAADIPSPSCAPKPATRSNCSPAGPPPATRPGRNRQSRLSRNNYTGGSALLSFICLP